MIRFIGRLAFELLNRRLMLKRVRGGIFIYFLLLASGQLLHLTATAQFTAYSNEFLNIGAGARGMAELAGGHGEGARQERGSTSQSSMAEPP